MPAHLHLHWPSWFDRKACAAKKNSTGMMLGVDSNGNCVWWDGDEPEEQLRWECLSDGTCEQSASSRATFESEDACLAGCAHAWECISDIPNSRNSGARYCLPSNRSTMHSGHNTAPLEVTYDSGPDVPSVFASIGACEAACVPTYSTTQNDNLVSTCTHYFVSSRRWNRSVV